MGEQIIQLKHPQGKTAVSINKDKYDLLTTVTIQYLTERQEGTFSEILKSITQIFMDKKIIFDGVLNCYLEWVKLDLEARQIIAKFPKNSPQKYKLTKSY